MIWLITAELVLSLLLITAIGVALLARIPWRWVQWGLWFIAVGASIITGMVLLTEGTQPTGPWRKALTVWQYLFTTAGPRPTLRLLSMIAGASIMLFPLSLGMWGLRRNASGSNRGIAGSWSLGILTLCIAGNALLLASTIAINDWLIRRELHGFLASAESKARELLAASVPDDQNAYVWYRQAALLAAAEPAVPKFNESKREPDHRWVADYHLTDEEMAQVQAFFDSRQQVVALFDRASGCTEYAAKPSLDSLWDDDLERRHWRALVEFLRQEGHLSVVRGDPSRAYANAARLRHLVLHMQRDPRMLLVLTATGVEYVQARLIEHAMQVRPPTLEEAANLRIAAPDYRAALAGTIDYEESRTKAELADILLFKDSLDRNPLSFNERRAGLAAVFGRLLYARDDLSAVAPHFQHWRKVALENYEEDEELLWPKGGHVRGGGLVGLIVPVVWAANDSARRAAANRRMSDIGIELTAGLTKLDEDAIRRRLVDVKLPEDPYDGKPLRADIRSGGIVIYSVGRNKVDHCGVEEAYSGEYGDDCLFLNDEFGSYRLIECKHPDLPWPRRTRE